MRTNRTGSRRRRFLPVVLALGLGVALAPASQATAAAHTAASVDSPWAAPASEPAITGATMLARTPAVPACGSQEECAAAKMAGAKRVDICSGSRCRRGNALSGAVTDTMVIVTYQEWSKYARISPCPHMNCVRVGYVRVVPIRGSAIAVYMKAASQKWKPANLPSAEPGQIPPGKYGGIMVGGAEVHVLIGAFRVGAHFEQYDVSRLVGTRS